LDGYDVCWILLGGKMSFAIAQQSCKTLKAEILEFQNEEEKEEFLSNKVIKMKLLSFINFDLNS
jgi:hypothetical protein